MRSVVRKKPKTIKQEEALDLRAYNRLEGQPGAKHGIRRELGPYTNTASPCCESKISLEKNWVAKLGGIHRRINRRNFLGGISIFRDV